MKMMVLVVFALLLGSCSTTNFRNLASGENDLSGTAIGVAMYPSTTRVRQHKKHGPHKWKTKPSKKKYRATRIYLKPVENEPGNYYGIVLEYVNLLKMAPKYIASNKLPIVSRKIGYLNSITKRITVYKVTPSGDEGVYEMQKLNARGGRLEVSSFENPSKLILSKDKNLKHPLEGARITPSKHGEPIDILFPKLGTKENHGFQYNLANFTYEKVKLESTWRMNFLPGPYLAAYGDKGSKLKKGGRRKHKPDTVLSLKKGSGDKHKAKFFINPNRAHLTKEKRERQFTNPKSAWIEGDFEVTEPADGIFVFRAVKADQASADLIENKLGLFIDIFDATKSLNQDVVELVIVDSQQPEDFHMYYEHPENGEGE